MNPAKPLAETNRPSVANSSVGHSPGKNLDAAEVNFYAVMKAQPWSALTVANIPMIAPPDGPSRWIAVFDTREQAVKWCDGDETHIAQMRTV